jgi:hypothetical protein
VQSLNWSGLGSLQAFRVCSQSLAEAREVSHGVVVKLGSQVWRLRRRLWRLSQAASVEEKESGAAVEEIV